jgi:hypothetical protein
MSDIELWVHAESWTPHGVEQPVLREPTVEELVEALRKREGVQFHTDVEGFISLSWADDDSKCDHLEGAAFVIDPQDDDLYVCADCGQRAIQSIWDEGGGVVEKVVSDE